VSSVLTSNKLFQYDYIYYETTSVLAWQNSGGVMACGRKPARPFRRALFCLDLFSYFFVSRQKSTRQIVRDESLHEKAFPAVNLTIRFESS
jgi:hypothetical protein